MNVTGRCMTASRRAGRSPGWVRSSCLGRGMLRCVDTGISAIVVSTQTRPRRLMVVTRVPGRSTAAPADFPVQPGPRDVSAEDLPHDRASGVAAVFEIHYAHLVRLAWALVGDPTEAEDVVMDAFAGLERRWSHVRRTDDAFFYLRTSVVNGS